MDGTRYTSDVAFTPTVKAVHARKGSRKLYARMERPRPWAAAVPPELARFIEARTSVFLATANAAGQPYIQHRGGPAGFLRVLDDHTLGFANFAGNRQYITQGNLAKNPKACLFLIDYAQRHREKIWGEARVLAATDELAARLMPRGYRARLDQAILFPVVAWDANCPHPTAFRGLRCRGVRPPRRGAAGRECAAAQSAFRLPRLVDAVARFPTPTPQGVIMTIAYRTVPVHGLKVFYREAGDTNAPTVLLLHGFPTSSHMFRGLIPALAEQFHVVAPDLPGFGFTDAPDRAQFTYSFDHLADVIDAFTEILGLNRYALYVFDYGAPVGLRLALRHPERITAVISQNGNAYLEGLSEGWNPIQKYWKEPSAENRAALRAFLSPDATRWQYMHGAPHPERLSPDAWTFDSALLARPGNDEIQLDLFGDYQSNVALYPQFQEYFRTWHPPLLAVWGKNDPFFLPAGAAAFKRDIPDSEIHLLDGGHFALESNGPEIASLILEFLARKLPRHVRHLQHSPTK